MTASRRPRASPFLRQMRLWDRRVQRGKFPSDVLLAFWQRRVEAAREAEASEAGELSRHLASILRVLLAGRINTVEEAARNAEAADSAGLRSDLASLWSDLVAAQQLAGTDPMLEPELGRLTRLQASLTRPTLGTDASELLVPFPTPFREVSGATVFSSGIVTAWGNGRRFSFASSSALSRLLGMPFAPLDEFDEVDEVADEDVADWAFGWQSPKDPSFDRVGDAVSGERIAHSPEPGPSQRGASNALRQKPIPRVLAHRFGTRIPAIGFTRRLIGKASPTFGNSPLLPTTQARSFSRETALPLGSAVAAGTMEMVARPGTAAGRGGVIQRSSLGLPPVTRPLSRGELMPRSAEATSVPAMAEWGEFPRFVETSHAVGEEVALTAEPGSLTGSPVPADNPHHSATGIPLVHTKSAAPHLNLVDESAKTSGHRTSQSYRSESFVSARYPMANRPTAVRRQSVNDGQSRPAALSLGILDRLRFAPSRQRLEPLGLTVDGQTHRPGMLDGWRSPVKRVGDVVANRTVGQVAARDFNGTPRTRIAHGDRQLGLWEPGSRLATPIRTASASRIAHLVGTQQRGSESSRIAIDVNGPAARLTPAIGMFVPTSMITMSGDADGQWSVKTSTNSLAIPCGALMLDWPATVLSRQATGFAATDDGSIGDLTVRRSSESVRVRSADNLRMPGSSRLLSHWLSNSRLPLPRSALRLSDGRMSRIGDTQAGVLSAVTGRDENRSEARLISPAERLGVRRVGTDGWLRLSYERRREQNTAGLQLRQFFGFERLHALVAAHQTLVGSGHLRANRQLSAVPLIGATSRLFQTSGDLPLNWTSDDFVGPVGQVDVDVPNEHIVAVRPGARVVTPNERVTSSLSRSAPETLAAGRGLLFARRNDALPRSLRSGRRFASPVDRIDNGAPMSEARRREDGLVERSGFAVVRPRLGRRHDPTSTIIGRSVTRPLGDQRRRFLGDSTSDPSPFASLPVSGRGAQTSRPSGRDVFSPADRMGSASSPVYSGKGPEGQSSLVSAWSEPGEIRNVKGPAAPRFVFDLPMMDPNLHVPPVELGPKRSRPTGRDMALTPEGDPSVIGRSTRPASGLFPRSLGATARPWRTGIANFTLALRETTAPGAPNLTMPKTALSTDGLTFPRAGLTRSVPFTDLVVQLDRSNANLGFVDIVARGQGPDRERGVSDMKESRRAGSIMVAPRMARSAESSEGVGREGRVTIPRVTKMGSSRVVSRGFSGVSRPWGLEGPSRIGGKRARGLSATTAWEHRFSGYDRGGWGEDPGRTGDISGMTLWRFSPMLTTDPWSAWGFPDSEGVDSEAARNPHEEASAQATNRGALVSVRGIDQSVPSALARTANEERVVQVRPDRLRRPKGMVGLSREASLMPGITHRIIARGEREMPTTRQRPLRAPRTDRPMLAQLPGAVGGMAELPQARNGRHDDFLAQRRDASALPTGLSVARFAFSFRKGQEDEESTTGQAARQIADAGGALPLTMATWIDQTAEPGRGPSGEEAPGRGRSRATSEAFTAPAEVARRTTSSYRPGPELTLKTEATPSRASAGRPTTTESRTVGAPIAMHSTAASSTATTIQRFGDGSEAESNQSTPSVDLDTLARQVYALLKQRLAVERERSGLRGGRRGW